MRRFLTIKLRKLTCLGQPDVVEAAVLLVHLGAGSHLPAALRSISWRQEVKCRLPEELRSNQFLLSLLQLLLNSLILSLKIL
jgi:hypothetical protein